ncbi:MAG: hypothetical protein Kilf2KO_44880 [Rhodospirillales bacterium]
MADREARRRRVSISTLFSTVVALIVLASMGTLFAISTVTSRLELQQSFAERFDFVTGTLAERVDDHLSAVEAQLEFLDRLLLADPALLADRDRLAAALHTSVAAAPQVAAVALVGQDGRSLRYDRFDDLTFANDLSERADIRRALEEARRRGPEGAPMGWSDPFYSPTIGRSVIALRKALWREGRFEGLLLAAVDLFALSRYAGEVSANVEGTIFILQGRERVIAHPNMPDGGAGFSTGRPLAALGDLGDQALAAIWREGRRPVISQAKMTGSEGHYLLNDGEWQVYVYTEVAAYGTTPWLIGYHFKAPVGSGAVGRFWTISAIGLALLIAFTLLGFYLGRRLSRPFRLLTDNAQSLQRLDFDALKPMHGSRILELDQTAMAFAKMVQGLRVFGRYVPRRVVEWTLRDGGVEVAPDERRVTLLFTDIAGFSKLAERLTPKEIARLLNRHFAALGACIEAEGGTIDKYVGDGLVAFWGAPDRQEDQADRACRAALALRETIAAENEERLRAGELPIRMRIGIHSGSALVGDIGARSRINFTAIGDAVNIASRVESEGRHHPQGDVTILITEATLAATSVAFATEAIGPTFLRGRTQPVTLHRLCGPGAEGEGHGSARPSRPPAAGGSL